MAAPDESEGEEDALRPGRCDETSLCGQRSTKLTPVYFRRADWGRLAGKPLSAKIALDNVQSLPVSTPHAL